MDQEGDEEYVDTSSEVGKLIAKIKQLEKRPLLDNSLGEVLESFMKSLDKSDDFLKNGIFRINFAESALLLQSSAFIYSKKVDLLWDMINECQKRLVSLKKEDNEIELRRIEEREKKYKRRKQIDTTHVKEVVHNTSKSFHIDFEEINNFQDSHYEKDSKLYSEWYKKMVCNWDLQPTSRTNRSLADKQVQFRSPENAICDQDQDNEFVVYTSKMESVISLEGLISSESTKLGDFSFELYSELYLIPKFLQENQLRRENLEQVTIEVEKYLEHYRDQYFSGGSLYDKEYDGTLVINKHSRQKLRRISVSSTVVPECCAPEFEEICVKKCQVNLLRLSVDDLCKYSRLSVDEMEKYYSEAEDFHMDNFHENYLSDNESIRSETEINKSSACNIEKPSTDTVVIDKKKRKLSIEKDSPNKSFTFIRVDYKTESSQKKPERIVERTKNDDNPEKRRKLSKAAIRKLAVGITVDLDAFETFMCANYQPEEGEGLSEPEILFDDPIDSSSRIGLDEECPLSQLSDHPILCTQDSGYESHFQYNEDTSFDDIVPPTDVDNIIAETLQTAHPILEEPPAQPTQTTEDNTSNEPQTTGNCASSEDKPLHQRVYEWKQFMSDKFKTLKSADFNIHEYGSNIMENFQGDKPRKFGDIVKGKSAAEVTRYFISALQLTNTHNVEILGGQNGKLSNETFELKLITKERYYDRLKDYIAPSEQDYRQRLSTVRKIKKRKADLGEFSGSKRNRLE